jgi:multidrug efflux pump subunit AcrA (membrane-fusion protein)
MANEPYEKVPLNHRLEAHETARLSDGRENLGDAFADPNSLDDTKLGESFVATNSSAKTHRRSPGQMAHDGLEEPLKRSGAGRTVFVVAGVVLLLMVIALIAGAIPRYFTHQATEKNARNEKQAPEVEVVKVMRSREASGLVVPGTTTPLTESAIYARANGFLRKRYVDIGDHVRKGQLLAVIDAPDLDQQVDQARRQVEQAKAQQAQQEANLALTKVTFERYSALVAKGVFSRQDGDQAAANYQQQVANVAAAARNVEAYQANLQHEIALQSYERITAPFDGVVTARNVDQGDLIQAAGSAGGAMPGPTSATGTTQMGASNTSGSSGSANSYATPSTGSGGQGGALFTIANNHRLRILVSVPEGYSQTVRTGVQAEVRFEEYPDQVYHGDVTRAAGSLDQNSRTELVEVQLDNANGKLLPGMYAVVTFPPSSTGEGPLLITGDAVAVRNDRPTVAVIDSDNTVQLTPVTIGRDLGSELEIVGGLREGELIAATFTDDVAQGAKIRPRMDQKAMQQANPPATPVKPNPPGGSTQYGDPGIIDQGMQGQNDKPQQKRSNGGEAKAAGKKGGQQP